MTESRRGYIGTARPRKGAGFPGASAGQTPAIWGDTMKTESKNKVGGQWASMATLLADNEGRVILRRERAERTTVKLDEGHSVCLTVTREDRPHTEWQAIALDWSSRGWIVKVQGEQHVRISRGETGRDGLTWEMSCSGPCLARWELGEPYTSGTEEGEPAASIREHVAANYAGNVADADTIDAIAAELGGVEP